MRFFAKALVLLVFFMLLHSAFASGKYEWKLARPAGSGCSPPNCTAGKFQMAIVPIAAADGSLGSNGSDMPRSSAGQAWVYRDPV